MYLNISLVKLIFDSFQFLNFNYITNKKAQANFLSNKLDFTFYNI